MNEEKSLRKNIRGYDKIYDKYERIHNEIFNPIEQMRLHEDLKKAALLIKTQTSPQKAIDYGCGTGNLTKHLLDLGFNVVSADISDKFLLTIKQNYGNNNAVETLKINGRDLSSVESGAFDLIGIYSVLHHIPDYLSILREIARIVKSGGVIYIDHEKSDSYWRQSDCYKEFLRCITPKKKMARFFKISNYVTNLRRLFNPRYFMEGDIHLWPDDHIEWEKIKRLLQEEHCEIILEKNYLLYKGTYPQDIYEKYKEKCDDMRCLAARKR